MSNNNNQDRKEYDRLRLDDTHIPDIFVIRYTLSLDNPDAINLYLWLSMFGCKNKPITKAQIKKLGLFPANALNKALEDLIEHDLVKGKNDSEDSEFVLYDLKEREVEEYYDALKARGDNLEPTSLTADENARNILADSVSSTFYQGCLPYIFYRLIDKCLYEYAFNGQVIYKLFEEGFDNGFHRNYSMMENLASKWYKRGYTDVTELEKMLDANKRVAELIKLVGKLLRKRLNDLDIERIDRWVEQFDTNADMVTLAIRENEWRPNGIALKHIEDTLAEWFAHGIKTVDEAAKFADSQHKEKATKAKRRRTNSRTSSAWRTGEEAGITVDDEEAKKEIDEDPILNQFDDDDEKEESNTDTESPAEPLDPRMLAALRMFGGSSNAENN